MTWIVWVLLALLSAAVILIGLAIFGAARWAGKTRGLYGYK